MDIHNSIMDIMICSMCNNIMVSAIILISKKKKNIYIYNKNKNK